MNTPIRVMLTGVLALTGITFPILAAGMAEPEPSTNPEAVRDLKPQKVTVVESAPHIPRFNTISTRLAIPFLWTPFHLGTVNGPVLKDQDARVLGDALRNVSGVNPQTQSGVGDYFLLRGFDSVSSGLVLTDGAAEPELTFYHMYNVDRIEVLKGPGGFLYSRNGLSGAAAGAVNIVRRQPMPGNFTRLNLSGGSYSTFQGTVDWNVTSDSDRFSFRLNAMIQESDSFRDDKDSKVWAFNPAFTWLLGSKTSLNLNLEYVNNDYQPDSGLPLVDGEIANVHRTTSYQSPFDRSEQDISRIQVDLETRLSNSWTLRNKTFYRDLDWETNGTVFQGLFGSITTSFTAPAPAPTCDGVEFIPGRLCRTLTLLDNNQTFFGNQLEAIWSATRGNVKHSLLTGLELARYSNRFTLDGAFLPSMDPEDPVETADEDLLQRFAIDEGDADTDVIAPYAIYQVKFFDRFQVLAGARVDFIDFEDSASGDSRDDSDVSPMLGLVYSLAENLTIFANAAESFAPPTARVDDPKPEESQQFEFGLKVELAEGKIITSVSAYRLERKNIPIPDANGFTQQSGDQRSRGIELEIVAEPLPRFRMFFTYTYTDAELTEFTERVTPFDPVFFFGEPETLDHSGNDPAFVPQHMLNLWVSKRFENGLGLGAGGRYVSSQFIDVDNQFEIDDYVVLDAAVYYDFGDWDLSLNFKNITGEEYETRGFGSTSVIPANQFTVYGTVGYSF